MGARDWIELWPAWRQLTGPDRLGLGAAVKSRRTSALRPRVAVADRVAKSVCPYCAVGCGQKRLRARTSRVIQIEGDPDSPVSRGRLCPKGSASLQLTTGDAREYRVRYRRPFGTEWEDLDLEVAMDMIADRVHRGPPGRLAVGGRDGQPDAPDDGFRRPGRARRWTTKRTT